MIYKISFHFSFWSAHGLASYLQGWNFEGLYSYTKINEMVDDHTVHLKFIGTVAFMDRTRKC